MSDHPAAAAGTSKTFGVLSLVSGIIALIGVLMIGQASWTWVPGFDPADWLRVVTGWMLPVGAVAAVIFGVLSLRREQARGLSYAGIALAVISIGIFIAMLVTHPY